MSDPLFSPERLQQLFRYACALTLNEDNAYDLLQSALEKFLQREIKNTNHPMAYMRTIIRNLHIDHIRRDGLIQWDDFHEETDTAPDMDWLALERQIINEKDVSRILQTLTGADREILFLWAVEGYTTAEVAEQLGIPKGTLLSRIHRLRQKASASRDTLNGAAS